MKKILFIIISVLLLTALSFTTFAHSGRTDSKGGHRDNINGGYHYHHGYPAHQHTDGECPYTESNPTATKNEPGIVTKILGCTLGSLFIGYIFACIPTSVISLILIIFFKHNNNEDLISNIIKWCTIIFSVILIPILFYSFWNN